MCRHNDDDPCLKGMSVVLYNTEFRAGVCSSNHDGEQNGSGKTNGCREKRSTERIL